MKQRKRYAWAWSGAFALAVSLPAQSGPLEAILAADRLISAPDDPFVLGTEGNAHSLGCALSHNGQYVAFASSASQLVANDNNDALDAFVKNRATGEVTRVNLDSDGGESVGLSYAKVVMSDDGRYLAFVTSANLIDGGEHDAPQIYWLDRQTGAPKLVTRNADGDPVGDVSPFDGLYLSGDGRYVLFDSSLGDFVDSDTNGTSDVFRFFVEFEKMERWSLAEGSVQADQHVYARGISNDGQLVLMDTVAPLRALDGNNARDAYVRDTDSNDLTRVSLTDLGKERTVDSYACAITGAGTAALFRSSGVFTSNEPPTDARTSEDEMDIYRYRLSDGEVSLVSAGAGGLPTNRETQCGFVGKEASSVAFSSLADNLIGPSKDAYRAFQVDQRQGVVSLLGSASSHVFVAAVSDDANVTCLVSTAHDLVAGDRNLSSDVFVVDRDSLNPVRVSVAQQPHPMRAALNVSFAPAMDRTGSRIAFLSASPFLDAGNFPAPRSVEVWNQVYLYDDATQDIRLLSRSVSGEPAQGESRRVAVSANGRYVAFESFATNLDPAASSGERQIYRVDLETDVMTLISADPQTGEARSGELPSVSDDGKVAFQSRAFSAAAVSSAKVLNDTEVLVWDNGSITVVAHGAIPLAVAELDNGPVLSADGRYVAFYSSADDLVATPSANTYDLYRRHLATGHVERINVDSAGTPFLAEPLRVRISGDGEVMLFGLAFEVPEPSKVYVRANGQTTELGAGRGVVASALSADGRFVLYREIAGQLERQDLLTGRVTVLDLLTDRGARLSIADGGEVIALDTRISLLPQDTNNTTDVYRLGLPRVPGDFLFDNGFEAPGER